MEVFLKLRSWQGSLQIAPSAALAVLYCQGMLEHFEFSQAKKKREKAPAELGNPRASWLKAGYLLLFLAQEQFRGL